MSKEVRPTQEGGLGRREFLFLTSSCAAATLALGPNLFAGVLSSPRDVAVGFLPIETVDAGDRLAGILSADAIPGSDGSFISRGTRVRMAGVGIGNDSRRTITFQSHYLIDGGSDAPVDVYRYERNTRMMGGLAEFGMPIDVDQRLRFSLTTAAPHAQVRRRDDDPEPRLTLPVTFSLRSEADAVRLTRGYYVIVPLHDGAAAPRWSATTLRAKDGQVLMHEMTSGGLQPVEREHFVLRIDYATAD